MNSGSTVFNLSRIPPRGAITGGGGGGGGNGAPIVITQVEPPEPDDNDDYGSGSNRTYDGSTGAETMRYKAYYDGDNLRNSGDPTTTTTFAPLYPGGYAKGNFASENDDPSYGLWGRTTTLNDRGDVNEEFEGVRAPVSAATTTGNKNEGTQWKLAADGDPWSSGRSFLLDALRSEFAGLITPLTSFVARYAALSGISLKGGKIYDFISVRKLFDVHHQNNDWDGLINALYGGEGVYNFTNNIGQDGSYYGDTIDHSELADAVMQLVREKLFIRSGIEPSRSNIFNDDDSEGEEEVSESTNPALLQARRLWSSNKHLKRRKASQLLENYNSITSGRVVFLLEPELRELAQSTLDTINEAYRGTLDRPDFKLLEVMNSGAPKTVFINLMILATKAVNNTGVIPITGGGPPGSGGLYGNGADRISSGSANYQNRTYGGGGNTNIILSRPTVANLVATSLEYRRGLLYFGLVEKSRDGKGGLVYMDSAKRKEYDGMDVSESLKRFKRDHTQDGNGKTHDAFVYDDRKGKYIRLPPGTVVQLAHTNASQLPIMTLHDALQRVHRYPYGGERGGIGRYNNPNVLSYIDKRGESKLVSVNLLYDVRALQQFYSTGNVGTYGIPLG